MRKFIATLGITAMAAVAAPAMAQTQVAAVPLVQNWQRFTDAQEGAFSAEVPAGWKVQGGTVRRNALQYRNYLTVTSPDGNTILAINDPNEWGYVIPTQMLSMAGFREGSIYNGGGGTLYTVASYRNGAQFSAVWGRKQLANICRNVRVEDSRERPDLSGQINSYSSAYGLHHDIGEASFTCVNPQGQPMTAYVMTSVLSIGGQGGAIWYAEFDRRPAFADAGRRRRGGRTRAHHRLDPGQSAVDVAPDADQHGRVEHRGADQSCDLGFDHEDVDGSRR